jgi:copper chaperone CopZ
MMSENVLSKLTGVTDATVNFANETAIVEVGDDFDDNNENKPQKR